MVFYIYTFQWGFNLRVLKYSVITISVNQFQRKHKLLRIFLSPRDLFPMQIVIIIRAIDLEHLCVEKRIAFWMCFKYLTHVMNWAYKQINTSNHCVSIHFKFILLHVRKFKMLLWKMLDEVMPGKKNDSALAYFPRFRAFSKICQFNA